MSGIKNNSNQQQHYHHPSTKNNFGAANMMQNLSAESVASLPPPGLSGPNSFTFSPSTCGGDDISEGEVLHGRRTNVCNHAGRYLSFLSSMYPGMDGSTNGSTAVVSGSGGGTGGSGSGSGSGSITSSGSSSAERKLYAVDMLPFLQSLESEEVEAKEILRRKGSGLSTTRGHIMDVGGSTDVTMENESADEANTNTCMSGGREGEKMPKLLLPITDPASVYRNHVFPLLSSQQGTGVRGRPVSGSRQPGAVDGDAALSLEERLRRERQRIHSSGGVTQFSWSTVEHQTKLKMESRTDPYDSVTLEGRIDLAGSTTRIPQEKKQHAYVAGESSLGLRILVPLRGNIYIQDGVGDRAGPLRLVYDKSMLEGSIAENRNAGLGKDKRRNRRKKHRGSGSGSVVGRDASAIDPQLSPDGTMVAFVVAGEIYVMQCPSPPVPTFREEGGNMEVEIDGMGSRKSSMPLPVRVTFGAMTDDGNESDDSSSSFDMDDCSTSSSKYPHGRCITHGLADFVAQEEMDRYRGFWWDPSSSGIMFTRVDESMVPPYRIIHQGHDSPSNDDSVYEEHRYPFAGEVNPDVRLGYVSIDRETISRNEDSDDVVTDECDVEMSKGEDDNPSRCSAALTEKAAQFNWSNVRWFDPPPSASEYLARVSWLTDGTACAQWQNRAQSTLLLIRIDIHTGQTMNLLSEQSDVWINLHHMLHMLPRAVHPDECYPRMEEKHFPPILPEGSFSFLFASERTGFMHLYLYTYIPGYEQATLIRTVSAGDWMVESIAGVDVESDVVYITGTYDSPLERHMYALPITNRGKLGADKEEIGGVRRGLKHVMNAISGAKPSSFRLRGGSLNSSGDYTSVPAPLRLTPDQGMHSVVMDDECRTFVDASSDLSRPTSVKVYALPDGGPFFPEMSSNSMSSPLLGRKSMRKQHSAQRDMAHSETSRRENARHDKEQKEENVHGVRLLFVLWDAAYEDKKITAGSSSLATRVFGSTDAFIMSSYVRLPPPELISFPTSDGAETLHAALYRPDPRVHGPGPYPLICAVYGGPHVQRVNRSWSQCADMRAQRLCSLGFAVVKCDNRGSSRRGIAFESAIKRKLGRLEVLDQVTAVRHLTARGIADRSRVGIYGWSYGGYLAAMCLCRAPDVFHVAVAGAPVTSWDGYDTHYTERYMGLPSENQAGYREAAVFDHVPNMRGKLMIVHGLIDENVHFRHTARLINKLIAAGKDYDLLIFPDERHSPRRLRDRIYMEQRISDYFVKNLLGGSAAIGAVNPIGSGGNGGGPFQQRGVGIGKDTSSGMRTMAGHL